ncbi:unnamed protein product, partial [Symbiodinium sp. CCMP2456]
MPDSSKGRFSESWQNYEYGEDERKALEATETRKNVAKAKALLSRALHDSHVPEALEALETLMDCGQKVGADVLRQVLMLAALADAERFGKAVNAAVRGGVRFDEQAFATLIGTLLANEAPFAMVRCAMNLGLPQ